MDSNAQADEINYHDYNGDDQCKCDQATDGDFLQNKSEVSYQKQLLKDFL